ncbi:MAG TPA: RNA 2',3'-cyclic phosphodiesterase [Pyrinomonadaceae bacterium]
MTEIRGDRETTRVDVSIEPRDEKKHVDDKGAQSLPVNSSTPASGNELHSRVNASRLRLFCAIELTSEVRARASEHITQLRLQMPRVRAGWERTEKLHLTLKFFGDVEASRIPALLLAAERAASAIAPFTLTVADAGAFPSHGQPRVLWLGLHDASCTLARLHNSLESECAVAGFKREERSFHPHITIARLRQPAGARELAALHKEIGFEAMELKVNEITLMRSELGPGGSRYTALSRHILSV